MQQHHFNQLIQDIESLSVEAAAGGSFRVEKLQRLQTLFRDREAYRKFVLLILAEIQCCVESSSWSPIVPKAEKMALFRSACEAIDSNDAAQLNKLDEQLFALQPGWKRVWVHCSRRKGLDRHLILLWHAVHSFNLKGYDALLSGFHMICHYFSSMDSIRFRFSGESTARLLLIRDFWIKHPPQFTVKGSLPSRHANLEEK